MSTFVWQTLAFAGQPLLEIPNWSSLAASLVAGGTGFLLLFKSNDDACARLKGWQGKGWLFCALVGAGFLKRYAPRTPYHLASMTAWVSSARCSGRIIAAERPMFHPLLIQRETHAQGTQRALELRFAANGREAHSYRFAFLLPDEIGADRDFVFGCFGDERQTFVCLVVPEPAQVLATSSSSARSFFNKNPKHGVSTPLP